MKILAYLLLIVTLTNCKPNPKEYIPYLNGYWEIQSVSFPNGKKQGYTINQAIDFISVNDSLKGFRKKLKPNFRGTFETSKHQENFTLKIENDSLNIYYKTPYAQWKETVLKASKTELVTTNSNKVIYLYKHYTPITTK